MHQESFTNINLPSNLFKNQNRSSSIQAQPRFVTTESIHDDPRLSTNILIPLSPKGQPENYESFKSWKNAREHLNTSGSPLSPNREKAIIQDKFRQTLGDDGKGFHKPKGYFTKFVNRNKILLDHYQADQKPGSQHTRYSFKPVFFTALETKNKLYDTSELDHSHVMGETQKAWTKAGIDKDFKKLGTSIFKKDIDTLEQSAIQLPLFDNPKSNDHSKLAASPFQTPRKKPILVSSKGFETPKGGSNLIKIKDNAQASESQISFKPMMRTSSSYDKFYLNSPGSGGKSKLLQPIGGPNTPKLQEITKYQTKTITSRLIANVSQAPEIETDKYAEHNGDVEYKRDNAIMIPLMEKDRRHRKKAHETTPVTYIKGRTYKGYTESDSVEDIKKFEESLTGWAKSIPNFGKQRSTYTLPKNKQIFF